MHWKTDELVDKISKISHVKEIKIYGQLGDATTVELGIIIEDGERLLLVGFRCNANYLSEQEINDCPNVDFCQLTTGLAGEGGIHGAKKPNTFVVYGLLLNMLKQDYNVAVCGHFDELL